MDRINKVVYLLIVFFLGWLGIHKFLNGRIVAGIVQIVLLFLMIGPLLALIEFFVDIIRFESDSDGKVYIPEGFFDFT